VSISDQPHVLSRSQRAETCVATGGTYSKQNNSWNRGGNGAVRVLKREQAHKLIHAYDIGRPPSTLDQAAACFEAAWLALCICMAMYRAMAMYAMHDAVLANDRRPPDVYTH
jgi:hypothetical protein